MIGCECLVCQSKNPKNKRTRASVALELESNRCILIDTSTDLRHQALQRGLHRVDGVLFTHAHADHIHGIDELRVYNLRQLSAIPCYCNRDVKNRMELYLEYIFAPKQPPGFVPHLELKEISGEFDLFGVRVIPVPVWHGDLPIFGYRIGNFAYLTDVSKIPKNSNRLLEGLDMLVLDALRPRPHPTHFSLDQAIEVIETLRPKRAALTHLSHLVDHAAVSAGLPPGIELAYDGMVVDLEEF
jgi:phosphoribosyl 1,2-cyclic phosphate phosphodiesterase